MNRILFIFLTGWALSPTLFAASKADAEPLETRIDRYLSAGVKQSFAGSVLVVRDGKILLNKGYGYADREGKIACTPDTVFTTGSVTKQFTATAILKLVEMGKLKVSDPLSRFFPDLPADKQALTLHQLLIHGSGLPDGIGYGDFDPISQDAFFKKVFASELLHPPDTKYYYSNIGYSVLGRVIELVSGQEYEAFLRQHLFEPAGMRHTGYLLPDWEQMTLAKGYLGAAVSLGTLIERFQKHGEVFWALKANGGVHSTINDMYRWHLALKNNKVLSPAMTEVLTTAYIPENEEGSSHYAYGWAIFSSPRHAKIVSHNGGNGIYFFDYIWYPKEDALVLLATNGYTRENEVSWPIGRMLFDPGYQPKPIQKSVYTFTYEFINSHPPKQAAELHGQLRDKYPKAIGQPRTLNRAGHMVRYFLENPDWAVALFELNSRLFPQNGYVWDSLGQGYQAQNRKQDAIAAYRKAVEFGRASSQSALDELLAE